MILFFFLTESKEEFKIGDYFTIGNEIFDMVENYIRFSFPCYRSEVVCTFQDFTVYLFVTGL